MWGNTGFPSPISGEGGARSVTDGGAVHALILRREPALAGPHPSGSAAHLPPQGGKGFLGALSSFGLLELAA